MRSDPIPIYLRPSGHMQLSDRVGRRIDGDVRLMQLKHNVWKEDTSVAADSPSERRWGC